MRFLREFGTDAGLLLSHLVFWSGKGHDPEGWIYLTIDKAVEEIGLDSPHSVNTARRKLRDEGVLEETKRPRKRWAKRELVTAHPSPVLHYRVNMAVLAERLGLHDDGFADLEDIEF